MGWEKCHHSYTTAAASRWGNGATSARWDVVECCKIYHAATLLSWKNYVGGEIYGFHGSEDGSDVLLGFGTAYIYWKVLTFLQNVYWWLYMVPEPRTSSCRKCSQTPLLECHSLSMTNVDVKTLVAVNWQFLFWVLFLFINVLKWCVKYCSLDLEG
jgi:hypothetical protein